jgi:DNA end-binding protein Ku
MALGRPTWRGHLRLSLVSCPVALHTALRARGEVHFNLINPKTHNRIRMITTDPDTGPVERSSLVKGYEVDKGHYILLSEDDIRSVRLESTKTIDIERFVAADEIDRLYWNDPYFLVPDGKMADEPFAVIREAMAQTGRLALGRVVISTRERQLALEPRGKGLIAYSLRSHEEVRDPADAFEGIPKSKADPEMIDIARRIIEQKSAEFDPALFTDRYEEALKALIASKEKGRKPVAVEAPDDTNVVDLMSALRASLAGKSRPAARKAPAAESRRAAAPPKARAAPRRHAGSRR